MNFAPHLTGSGNLWIFVSCLWYAQHITSQMKDAMEMQVVAVMPAHSPRNDAFFSDLFEGYDLDAIGFLGHNPTTKYISYHYKAVFPPTKPTSAWQLDADD